MKYLQPVRISMLVGAVLLPAGLLWSTAGVSAQDQAMSHGNDTMSQDSDMSHAKGTTNDSDIAADPGEAGSQDGPVYQNRVGHDNDTQAQTGMSQNTSMPSESRPSDDATLPADPGNSGAQSGETYQDPIGGDDNAMPSDSATTSNMNMSADADAQSTSNERNIPADPGSNNAQSDTYQAPLDGDEPMAGDDDGMSRESGISNDDEMKEGSM